MDQHAARGVLDRDRHVAPDEVVEDLARPFDRSDAAAMDGALGADLDLGMDELAHRRLVALAEGGQEAASELV